MRPTAPICGTPPLVGSARERRSKRLTRDGEPLSDAERRALYEPKPNQSDLRRAALKLAKYLRIE